MERNITLHGKEKDNIKDFIEARKNIIEDNLRNNKLTVFCFQGSPEDEFIDNTKITYTYKSKKRDSDKNLESLFGYLYEKDIEDGIKDFIDISIEKGFLPFYILENGIERFSVIARSNQKFGMVNIMREDNEEVVKVENNKLRFNCGSPHCKIMESPGVYFKRCSKCKMVKYCSRECQVNDWKEHKTHCK